MYRSYHGATGAAITMTGDPRRWPSEPDAVGMVKFWGPYPYRSAFHSADEAEESARALQHLSDVIMVEGAHTIAAIVLETVVGTNGILVPPPGYLQGVRDLCDQHGIVMICDEVMAGFGRCGEWFAVDHWNVTPDLICFAKGVNSGYVPLGGVVIRQAIADTFKERPYPGGLTYSGHPLACAAAVASITIFKEEGVLEHARMLGTDVIGPALRELQERHPSVGDVRGLGVFWAIELVRNRGHARAARALQRLGRGGGTDERGRGGLQGQGRVAVLPLQPHPRRAAVHDLGRRRQAGHRRHRRGLGTGRPPHQRLTDQSGPPGPARNTRPVFDTSVPPPEVAFLAAAALTAGLSIAAVVAAATSVGRRVRRRIITSTAVASASTASASSAGRRRRCRHHRRLRVQPEPITVDVGQEVTWTNDDPFAHSVKAADGSFDSGRMDEGAGLHDLLRRPWLVRLPVRHPQLDDRNRRRRALIRQPHPRERSPPWRRASESSGRWSRAVDETHREGMATVADDIAELHHGEGARLMGPTRQQLAKGVGLGGTAVALGAAMVPLSAAVLSRRTRSRATPGWPPSPSPSSWPPSRHTRPPRRAARSRRPAVLEAATTFAGHHTEHAAGFGAAAGSSATNKPNAKLLEAVGPQLGAAADEAALLEIAYGLENAAAATYLFALGALTSKEALQLTASILPVESQHAVVLGSVLGKPATDFIPGFETVDLAVDPAKYPIS